MKSIRFQIDVADLLEGVQRRGLDALEVVVVQDQPEQVRQWSQGSLREDVGRECEAQLENVQTLLDTDEAIVVELRQMVEG